MPADMSVDYDDADARRELTRIAVGLSDLRGFWPMLVPVVTTWWRRQFETEGAFSGSPWAALSPSYAAWKHSQKPGKPILQFEGDMKRAASRPHRSQTATTLTLSIEDPKIEYHQEGKGRLPKREVVFGDPLPPAAQQELDDVAEEYVRGLIGPGR